MSYVILILVIIVTFSGMKLITYCSTIASRKSGYVPMAPNLYFELS